MITVNRNSVRATTSPTSGGTQSDELQAKIKSVTSSATIGSCFIYDTRNDSDSGAWRKKARGSWYYEDLNTANKRGGRREFPSKSLIVADGVTPQNTIRIYDLDDPAIPMWMEFRKGAASWTTGNMGLTDNNVSSVFALNGRIYIGQAAGSALGVEEISFVEDTGYRYTASATAGGYYNGNIAERLDSKGWAGSHSRGNIVNGVVNDVAATVLEGAEIGALGLPIPTVAVACGSGSSGGLSIIHSNGDVYDKATTSAAATIVEFDKDGNLYAGQGNYITRFDLNTLYADGSTTYLSTPENDGTIITIREFSHGSIPVLINNTTSLAVTDDGFAGGSASGLTKVKFNDGNHEESAVAFVTSDYNSGYQLGDIRLAVAAIKNATVTEYDETGNFGDRSVKANTLTNSGTITCTPVATGAEAYGLSGFSASNYLSRANDTDFDFGTGDFSISLWVKNTNWTGTQRLLGRSQDSNTKRLSIYADGTTLYAYIKDTTTKSASADVLKNNVWQHVFAFRRGSVLYLFVDGKLVNSVAGADSINITPASNGMLVIGSETFDNGSTIESTALVNGSLSLVRISATAPTPTQVKEIYEAEKPLFRAGAKCLLFANVVKDLAFDNSTGLLSVGQDATTGQDGVVNFRGLEKVSSFQADDYSDWSANTTHKLAAAGGVSAYGRTSGTGGVIVDIPPFDVRGDTNIADTKLPDDGKIHFSAAISDSNPTTPTVIGVLPIAEGETYYITARVFCKQYIDNTSAVRASYVIEQKFRRPIGGNATASDPMSVLRDEGTASMDAVFSADTGSQQIRLTVTGVANTRSIWSAELDVERISEKQYER